MGIGQEKIQGTYGPRAQDLDPQSLGFTISQIIRRENLHAKEAAKILEVHETRLSAIIHGKAISREYAEDLGEKLKQKLPDGWREYEDEYLRRAEKLRSSPRAPSRPHAVSKENRLCFLLEQMLLGIGLETQREQAEFLELSIGAYKGAFFNGTPIQKNFAKYLGEKIKNAAPAVWREFGSAYEMETNAMPGWAGKKGEKQKKFGNAFTQPVDLTSLGHTMWLINGGNDPEKTLTRIGKDLDISCSALKKKLHAPAGEGFSKDEAIALIPYLVTFAGWKKYGKEYMERINTLQVSCARKGSKIMLAMSASKKETCTAILPNSPIYPKEPHQGYGHHVR